MIKSSMDYCVLCDLRFASLAYFREHINRRHPDKQSRRLIAQHLRDGDKKLREKQAK